MPPAINLRLSRATKLGYALIYGVKCRPAWLTTGQINRPACQDAMPLPTEGFIHGVPGDIGNG